MRRRPQVTAATDRAIARAGSSQRSGEVNDAAAPATGSVADDRIPSAAGTCEQTMRAAAAKVNAATTGWLMRYATMPVRVTPTRTRMAPTTRASRAASAAYRVSPVSARGLSAPTTNRLVRATGPVWR